MYKLRNDKTPAIFPNIIKNLQRKYHRSFSKTNFSLRKDTFNGTKYAIYFCRPIFGIKFSMLKKSSQTLFQFFTSNLIK